MATTAFVRGTDDAVWFRRTDRSAGYDTLWGAIQFGPTAVSPAGDLLDVFAVGTDGGLYHQSGSTGGPWSGWESLGGQLTATPSAVSVSPDRIDVFGRGVDDSLWTIARIGGSWTGWSKIGGSLSAAPGAATDPDSATATVGVRGSDGRLYELQFGSTGPGAAGFTYVGTPICSAPAYAARAGDGDLVRIGYRTGDFTLSVDGTSVGGQLKSAPALVSGVTAAKVAAFAQGADDALWMYQGTASTGTWSSLGGALR